MSVRKEKYLIKGIKLGEGFTEKYLDSEIYDELEYSDKDRNKLTLRFLSDGMNGQYTFFGQIQELLEAKDFYEDKIQEVKVFDFTNSYIAEEFNKHFPNEQEIAENDVKIYYVVHYS